MKILPKTKTQITADESSALALKLYEALSQTPIPSFLVSTFSLFLLI